MSKYQRRHTGGSHFFSLPTHGTGFPRNCKHLVCLGAKEIFLSAQLRIEQRSCHLKNITALDYFGSCIAHTRVMWHTTSFLLDFLRAEFSEHFLTFIHLFMLLIVFSYIYLTLILHLGFQTSLQQISTFLQSWACAIRYSLLYTFGRRHTGSWNSGQAF